jgi:hypothetical protein
LKHLILKLADVPASIAEQEARPMLAEIFMLRIEFLARVTAEPTKCSFVPTPTGGAFGLTEQAARAGDYHPQPKTFLANAEDGFTQRTFRE